MQKYVAPDLDVHYYKQFLSKKEADELLLSVQALFKEKKKRASLLVGNENIRYTVTYRGQTSTSTPLPWSTIPNLSLLKTRIEKEVQETLTVCVIQCYPSGKTGIGPHRDKDEYISEQSEDMYDHQMSMTKFDGWLLAQKSVVFL